VICATSTNTGELNVAMKRDGRRKPRWNLLSRVEQWANDQHASCSPNSHASFSWPVCCSHRAEIPVKTHAFHKRRGDLISFSLKGCRWLRGCEMDVRRLGYLDVHADSVNVSRITPQRRIQREPVRPNDKISGKCETSGHKRARRIFPHRYPFYHVPPSSILGALNIDLRHQRTSLSSPVGPTSPYSTHKLVEKRRSGG
jgi:hypothetical protein